MVVNGVKIWTDFLQFLRAGSTTTRYGLRAFTSSYITKACSLYYGRYTVHGIGREKGQHGFDLQLFRFGFLQAHFGSRSMFRTHSVLHLVVYVNMNALTFCIGEAYSYTWHGGTCYSADLEIGWLAFEHDDTYVRFRW
jgi:hypothetical protein